MNDPSSITKRSSCYFAIIEITAILITHSLHGVSQGEDFSRIMLIISVRTINSNHQGKIYNNPLSKSFYKTHLGNEIGQIGTVACIPYGWKSYYIIYILGFCDFVREYELQLENSIT